MNDHNKIFNHYLNYAILYIIILWLVFLIGIFFEGCSSADIQRDIILDSINGDVVLTVERSYNQENSPAQQFIGDTEIPIEWIAKIPVKTQVNRAGVGSMMRLRIGRIGGDFLLEILDSGNQNAGDPK